MNPRDVEMIQPESERSGPRILCRCSDSTLVGLLILLAALPYANTLFNAFVYDDNTQVLNNPYIQSFRYLKEIFGTTVWSYIGAQRGTNYYRPLMTFGYLICYQLFGPMAYGFHLANVLLHVASTCILFLVAWRIFRDRSLAFVAAALFAVHPIHAESVAWIAAVTDLQLTFFYLVTFWFFLGLSRPGGGRFPLAQLGLVSSYILTILSKEQALTIPVLATLYEHFYREDRKETTWKQKAGRYGLLWVLDVAYIAFRIRFLGSFVPILQRPRLTWTESFLSALALLGRYVWKLLWPAHLLAFYVFRKSSSLLEPRVLAGLGVLILGVVIFIWLWKHARLASFGLIWFIVTLVPVLNARWMAANVFAERYFYLPSVGFCMVVAWGWIELWARVADRKPGWRHALAWGLGLVVVLSSVRIIVRNRDWQNDVILYTRTLAVEPGSWHIRNNLGVTYWGQGNVEAAEKEWREALKINPEGPIILSNLGLVAAKAKRYEEAVGYFERALRIEPRFADAHLHLGETYLEMGSNDLAELQFRSVVDLSPLNVRGRNALGKFYLEAGQIIEGEEQFRRSVESEPNVTAFDGLGDIFARRGDRELAVQAYTRALGLDPFDSHAHFGLGAIHAQAGRTADAIREYQAGLLTNPHDQDALAALQKLTGQTLHGTTQNP